METDMHDSLLNMLRGLLKEMDYVQSQGAGYYSCSPFAKRFNKLAKQAARCLGEDNTLIQSFDPLEETDPKDTAEKSKRLLGIRIEIGQLIALLESTRPQNREPGH